MPDSIFTYRLLFLMLFMASIVTWVFLWLVGYIRHHPLSRSHPGNPGAVSLTGVLLVLLCAVFDFNRLFERNALLLAMFIVGLVIPWGAVLITKCQAHFRHRKFPSHN
ncbi:hypothetical protein [Pseudomonas putida]|uniref:hypothetical protein n=1 Tax=Pseudomonas putida TaxID=303 RepID=UPI00235D4F17|nr:hypothetical protein [Pseudomonas putida]GLO45297.1 hypothetical protein PPUN109347_18600 [Pseudomonas putida]GLO45472.1 hypothetical protein PPUN109347_20350 [Pseudomonas putida]HDS0982157.1 hypothetical protein [Pseudomonas putida]